MRETQIKKSLLPKIVKTFLEDIIVEKVNQYIGYSLNDITTEEFLQATRSILYNYTMQQTRLIKSDAYAGLKISDSNKITAINQFWQIVESNVLVSKSFQELLLETENDIKGKQLVSVYGIEANYSYYTINLTWAILEELQKTVFINDLNGLKVLEKLDLQQEINGTVKATVRFLRQVLKTTLAIDSISTYSLNTPEEYISYYTEKGYKIDTNYRRSIVFLNEIDSVEVPENIDLEKIKNYLNQQYNQHTDQLNRQWLQCFNQIEFKYSKINASKQYDFYNTEVANQDQKLVVIISDALRYEVGAELLSKMHGDTKNTAEIKYLLASIPSKTNVGMAQLLPGKKEFNKGEILSDGISAASTYRTKLLQNYKPKAEAVQFETVKNAKQADSIRVRKTLQVSTVATL